MSDTIPFVTEGGIAAVHAEAADFRALVGPSTGGEFNTVKAAIIPIACWRVDDIRFEFDSSFVQPGIETELRHLAELLQKHLPASMAKNATPPDIVGCPLSIFGHADPVGDDEYNKQLSGRRAMAIYGLLTRDVELWDYLFNTPIGNDKWGKKPLQTMVRETTVPKPTEEPDVSGIENNPTQRKALYLRYMDKLCERVDEEGKPKLDKEAKAQTQTLKLDKKDFLAQGADKGGKGDYQGCSEFNPILLFSQEEEKEFQQDKEDKTRRNQANAPNRRVMVLIFRKGTKVDPNRWPCPRAKEGTAGCKKRFWSDGEKRRTTKLQDDQRQFEETKDTFACRFYNRTVINSPCEEVVHKRFPVLLDDPFLGLLVNLNVQVSYAIGGNEALTTDDHGVVRVLVGKGSHVDLEFTTALRRHQLRVFIFPKPVSIDAGVWQRLVGLGHVSISRPPDTAPSLDALAIAVSEFQVSHGIMPTGELDEKTRTEIKKSYDAGIPWSEDELKELIDEKFHESASQRKDAVA